MALLTASLAFAGCSGRKAPAVAGTTDTAVPAANQKPPLVVPSAFASIADKQDFAVRAVADGYYAEAKPLLESVVASEPTPLAYGRLGTARYNVGELEEAIEAWKKAAEMDPGMTGEALNNAGNALRDLKRLAEAEAHYRKALEVEPTRWTAATNLAVILKSQDRSAEAITVLEQALANNKEVPPLASLLSDLKQETSKPNG